MKPLAIDLFCGLGGWTEGLLAEGYDVIGFDNMQHVYGEHRYPAQLVVQDVLTLHGSQFKTAALIVASPPCQGYSYRAMPWKRAKALPPPCNALFDACFRIQREACDAAGRHIPMIVENVRGAQPWVGRARWNYGSFYLWGDVPALMPITFNGSKVPRFRFDGSGKSFQSASVELAGVKQGGDWFAEARKGGTDGTSASFGSKSPQRKMASAMIAKIPLPLSRYIAATFRPTSSGIIGVAIVGCSVSRMRDDGKTAEVTRLCTDGTPNSCSFLYGAASRAAFALGFKRIGTYILATEPSTSLAGAGWRLIGQTKGGSWSRDERPRIDKHPTEPKFLFERLADEIGPNV